MCRPKRRGYFTVSMNGIIEKCSRCCWRKCFLFCYDHFIVLCYSESLAESVTSRTCISSFPALPHPMSFHFLISNHAPPPYILCFPSPNTSSSHVQPENIILVDPVNHKIKLIDFGCARDLSLEGDVSTLVGTAEFQGNTS